MDGRLCRELLQHYSRLGSTVNHPVGMINVQENVIVTSSAAPLLSVPLQSRRHQCDEVVTNEIQTQVTTTCADLIARTLGVEYSVASDTTKDPRLATVYNSRLFELVESKIVELPRLSSLPTWNKLFIKSGQVEQKHALVCDFVPNNNTPGTPIVLRNINFHLDAAGNNQHRKRQMASLLSVMAAPSAIDLASAPNHHIVSGDTNIFHMSHTVQQDVLQSAIESLSPFVSLLASDGQELNLDSPTHFFSRANEPTMIHQAGVFVGKHFGIDLPQCYDVVLTNLQVCDRGQVATPDCSDHDLVFATLVV